MPVFGILKLQLHIPHLYITPPPVVMKSGVGDTLQNTHRHTDTDNRHTHTHTFVHCKTCLHPSAAEFHLLTLFDKQCAGGRSMNPSVTFDLQEALQIKVAARKECTQRSPC